ncbi:MAG: SHOCT domain-containing protein, partial [Oscillospiraceae bacterium]|nr:SHOCT domain-containing protein [Oscillospiraceae bacterium]
TKIYINNSNKIAPIYIQCGDDNTNGKTSRRIILPKFEESDKEKIVQAVNDAKAEYDAKLDQNHDLENVRKLKDLEARRRAQDDEFENMTSGYKDMIKPQPTATPTPSAVSKTETASALAVAPKPVSTPIPQKPAPDPVPIPKNDSLMVEDILGLDDILGISADDMSQVTSFMDEISEEPDEEEINSMPVETIQKNPDKIEELTVPIIGEEYELEAIHEKKVSAAIEELDPSREIAKKLAPKQAPAPEVRPEAKLAEKSDSVPENNPESKTDIIKHKEESAERAEISISVNAENMSLEDFETAVKKLKSMLDNGVITESEFAIEKKKLFKLLY